MGRSPTRTHFTEAILISKSPSNIWLNQKKKKNYAHTRKKKEEKKTIFPSLGHQPIKYTASQRFKVYVQNNYDSLLHDNKRWEQKLNENEFICVCLCAFYTN